MQQHQTAAFSADASTKPEGAKKRAAPKGKSKKSHLEVSESSTDQDEKSATQAPPKPKRAPKPKTASKNWSGYTVFISENFESVKARNPAIGAKEVFTAMGNEWKSVSDKEKQAYSAKAAEKNRASSPS